MFTGIDIGGTNTDIAVVDGDVFTAKLPNTAGLAAALGRVKGGGRLAVSTSQPLNRLVAGGPASVHALTIPGVGLVCDGMVGGMVNHRGDLLEDIDADEVRKAITAHPADCIAICGKFSVRNPVLEERVYALAREAYPPDRIALSHHLAELGFPARVATTRVNARLMEVVAGITRLVAAEGRPYHLFKGDGGLASPEMVLRNPSFLFNSSPAAVALGASYLSGTADALVVDIGGTTTDLVPISGGLPLTDTLFLEGEKTFIRSIGVHSVPFGGDSAVGPGGIRPVRLGNARAFGGDHPTLTDALNRTGHAIGDSGRSASLSTGSATAAVSEYLDAVSKAIRAGRPDLLIGTGFLASELMPALSERTGIPFKVPDHAACANAVGVAVSRVSLSLFVHADSNRGRIVINGEVRPMGRVWSDEELIAFSLDEVRAQAEDLGAPAEDTADAELVAFRGYDVIRRGGRGRIADLVVRIRPGITAEAP